MVAGVVDVVAVDRQLADGADVHCRHRWHYCWWHVDCSCCWNC